MSFVSIIHPPHPLDGLTSQICRCLSSPSALYCTHVWCPLRIVNSSSSTCWPISQCSYSFSNSPLLISVHPLTDEFPRPCGASFRLRFVQGGVCAAVISALEQQECSYFHISAGSPSLSPLSLSLYLSSLSPLSLAKQIYLNV